jgi:hypothetical protein
MSGIIWIFSAAGFATLEENSMSTYVKNRFSHRLHTLGWHSLIKITFVIILIFALSICSLADDIDSLLSPPPGSYKILSEDNEIRIPFEMFRGDIRFEAEINGRKVRMLLDNGFLWDQILFFGSPLVDSLELEYDGEVQVEGSGEGDPVQSLTASGITISFPGVEFIEQTAIITPYSSGISNLWWGAEGQVSATFLKHFVVEINFDKMMLTLIKPEKFQYQGKGVEIQMTPLLPGAWGIPATLETCDGRTVSLDLMMDLGYGDALQISKDGPNNIIQPDKSIEASLGFGMQGETRGHFGRVCAIEIGGYRLDSVVAGFVAPEYTGNMYHETMIGMELFSRFNIVYDYPNQRMFIEPNQTFADPFEYDMSGLSMHKGRGDYLEILQVYPDSPASDAGLQIGDKVLSINGKAAIKYDVWDLRPLLRREGETITLSVLRGDKEMQISIVLRRLI